MTHVKIQNLGNIKTHNNGDWLSEKIYSDVKGNACACGGKFTAYKEVEGIDFPTCAACGKTPPRLRIRAKLMDAHLETHYAFIRHNLLGERLTSVAKALGVIDRVREDKKAGTFDFRKYDSAKNREHLAFDKFSTDYLAHQSARVDAKLISPKSFEAKQSAVAHLRKYFGTFEINRINRGHVAKFKASFTQHFRARDLALGELKTMLNYAVENELIKEAPPFAKIDRSSKREEVITAAEALRVIGMIESPTVRAIVIMLAAYPVRPSEMRALQWRDLDYARNEVTFGRHFSGDVLMDGRKSSTKGVTLPITAALKDYLRSLPMPLNREEFIFTLPGQSFIKKRQLEYYWSAAAAKAKVDSTLYELRHAKLTDIAEKSNGNILTMLKASGHTNSKILLERYVRPEVDMKEYFE